MTFVKVEGGVPEVKRCRYKLGDKLKEFVSMNTKCAEVNFRDHEYKDVMSCYTSLYKAAKIFCMPVDVVKRGDKIYLIRTDM